MDSHKNRDMFPIGTKVKRKYNRFPDARIGEVIDHDGDKMVVKWPDIITPMHFMPAELRRA
jgi:hypothetical protein